MPELAASAAVAPVGARAGSPREHLLRRLLVLSGLVLAAWLLGSFTHSSTATAAAPASAPSATGSPVGLGGLLRPVHRLLGGPSHHANPVTRTVHRTSAPVRHAVTPVATTVPITHTVLRPVRQVLGSGLGDAGTILHPVTTRLEPVVHTVLRPVRHVLTTIETPVTVLLPPPPVVLPPPSPGRHPAGHHRSGGSGLAPAAHARLPWSPGEDASVPARRFVAPVPARRPGAPSVPAPRVGAVVPVPIPSPVPLGGTGWWPATATVASGGGGSGSGPGWGATAVTGCGSPGHLARGALALMTAAPRGSDLAEPSVSPD